MKKINFSFICATIDNTNDVVYFLKHLNELIERNYYLNINLILIDQHKTCRKELFSKLIKNLKYIHSSKKGLSLNRNIGLKNLNSEIFSFIDCDCRLNDDYFQIVNVFFKKNKNDILYGKIKQIDNQNDLFKKWPRKIKFLSQFDKWTLSTSVNVIYRKNDLLLDETLGLGTNFGSCEDIDFALRQKSNAIYNPNLFISHPFQSFSTNDTSKIYSYAKGFGALCRKHLSIISTLLLLASFLTPPIKIVTKKSNFSQAKASICGKIHGFLRYKTKNI